MPTHRVLTFILTPKVLPSHNFLLQITKLRRSKKCFQFYFQTIADLILSVEGISADELPDQAGGGDFIVHICFLDEV